MDKMPDHSGPPNLDGLPDDPEEAMKHIAMRSAARMSVRQAAKILGMSPTTIHKYRHASDRDGMTSVAKFMGADNKVRPSRRFDTSARDDEIRRRRGEGESMRVIAEACDCSVGTVARVLNAG